MEGSPTSSRTAHFQNKNISTEKLNTGTFLFREGSLSAFSKSCGLLLYHKHLSAHPPAGKQRAVENPMCTFYSLWEQPSSGPKVPLKTGQMKLTENIKYQAVWRGAQEFNLQCVAYKHIPANFEQQN